MRYVVVAAGLVAAAVLVYGYVHRGGAGQPFAVCTVSSNQHDVNMVVAGNGAESFCGSQAKTLSGSGDFYVVRDDVSLVAPDYGTSSLTVACDVSSGPLEIKVYDDGGQTYGTDYCGQLEANGWTVNQTG